MGIPDSFTEVEKMQRMTPEMERLRGYHYRNLYGPEIDDYMRRLFGKESYYDEQARLESERYWADYVKNTGIEPRYPIRVGAQWNAPITTLPPIAIQTGKRAIEMLYGGQI